MRGHIPCEAKWLIRWTRTQDKPAVIQQTCAKQRLVSAWSTDDTKVHCDGRMSSTTMNNVEVVPVMLNVACMRRIAYGTRMDTRLSPHAPDDANGSPMVVASQDDLCEQCGGAMHERIRSMRSEMAHSVYLHNGLVGSQTMIATRLGECRACAWVVAFCWTAYSD